MIHFPCSRKYQFATIYFKLLNRPNDQQFDAQLSDNFENPPNIGDVVSYRSSSRWKGRSFSGVSLGSNYPLITRVRLDLKWQDVYGKGNTLHQKYLVY